jgi:hypothetical protein
MLKTDKIYQLSKTLREHHMDIEEFVSEYRLSGLPLVEFIVYYMNEDEIEDTQLRESIEAIKIAFREHIQEHINNIVSITKDTVNDDLSWEPD